jgi:hypothetical protein
MSTAAQISANQANAQHSTGPATEEGKARSARNNFRYGLASGQIIVPGEDPAKFEALAEDLFNEHQPATTTEENLVLSMAQHFWLGQRAIRLQNEAFADGGSVAQLSLLLRYQISNQRAYARCLADLFKLRTERHIGSERQKKFELANCPPKPRKPSYIRNPKYAHMLLIDVPEAERFIEVDPNAPELQTETPIAPINGFESQIDPRAEKLIRELRETACASITKRLPPPNNAKIFPFALATGVKVLQPCPSPRQFRSNR